MLPSQVTPSSSDVAYFRTEKVLCVVRMASFQIASMRPLGATDIVPNHWDESSPAGLLLTRIGALQVSPSSVLRMNMTSSGSGPGGSTDWSMYRLPLSAAWIPV